MKEFLRMYKKTFTGFPAYCRDLAFAFADLGAALLIVSLPLTYPILYPAAQLWKKVMRK
ncbi:hypothetical protein [Pseudomonas lactis]|uniref:hypothetical protein n=1 Tax=Pseudomonas lactis TaxID=1615674 RepID=UPI00130E779E|nr:hypothetical protein [Pseudomonas lactis]